MTEIDKQIHPASLGLTASHDETILVWAQLDHVESDLMLVEHFR